MMPVTKRLHGRGDQHAIVLVHPLPGDSSMFELLVPRLGELGTVIVVDLPDAGASLDHASLDPEDMVRDVHAVIAAAAPLSVILVGMSFGAWVAARVASNPPDNLVKAILISGFAALPSPAADAYNGIADDLDAGRTEVPALWPGLISGCFPSGVPDVSAPLDAMGGRISPARMARMLRRVARTAARDQQVAALRVPVTVLHGRNDAVVPLALGEQLATLGGTSPRIIETDSHLLSFTHVDACVEAITR